MDVQTEPDEAEEEVDGEQEEDAQRVPVAGLFCRSLLPVAGLFCGGAGEVEEWEETEQRHGKALD